MREAFDASPDAPFLNRVLLRWKYFDPNPDWPAAPRSYILANESRILAHGCAWPVQPGVACLIDWAGAKSVAGMGMLLARRMGQLSPVLLSIGGSEMTQKIMPKIGFAKQGELLTFARVLRPWKQAWTRPREGVIKAALRLGRNLGWSLAPSSPASGWQATENSDPHYEFLRRCPGASIRTFDLNQSGRVRGSLVLSLVRGQARIADLRIDSEDLAAALAAAMEAACRDPEACELIALAQNGPMRAALLANGFVERARRSVFVAGLSAKECPLRLSMLADDMAYLDFPESPYLT